MKKKITLVGLMLLIAVLTFGQIATEKIHLQYNVSSFESYSKANALKDMKYSPTRAIHNNRQRTQRNLLLTEQTIKHRLDSAILQKWIEGANQWDTESKDEFTYDASGNATLLLNYKWDQSTNQWVYNNKSEYTYVANGNMTQSLSYYWDKIASQWSFTNKAEYTYATNGDMAQTLYYQWDKSTSQWFFSYKTEYTYANNGDMIEFLFYTWDQDSSQWVFFTKRVNTYNANGNIIQFLIYRWNQITSQWVFMFKIENTFDVNSNIIQILESAWDQTNSQWAILEKEEFIYDLTYSFPEMIVPLWWTEEGHFSKLLEGFYYDWNETTDTWFVTNKYTTHYSQHNVSNVEILNVENFNISPNPVSEYLNISFMGNVNSATFELFDIQGRKVLSKGVVNHEQITLKELNNGMYIYNLYIEGKKQSGRLIKE